MIPRIQSFVLLIMKLINESSVTKFKKKKDEGLQKLISCLPKQENL